MTKKKSFFKKLGEGLKSTGKGIGKATAYTVKGIKAGYREVKPLAKSVGRGSVEVAKEIDRKVIVPTQQRNQRYHLDNIKRAQAEIEFYIESNREVSPEYIAEKYNIDLGIVYSIYNRLMRQSRSMDQGDLEGEMGTVRGEIKYNIPRSAGKKSLSRYKAMGKFVSGYNKPASVRLPKRFYVPKGYGGSGMSFGWGGF